MRDLFREDAAAYYEDLLAYAVPELETLESAFAWLGNLGADAFGDGKLSDRLDQAVLANTREGKGVPKDPNDQSASIRSGRVRANHAATSTRIKGASTGRVKPRPRAT